MIIGYQKDKFDFDSLDPVQGEQFEYSQAKADVLNFVIDWLSTGVVILLGVHGELWMKHTGGHMILIWCREHAPAFFQLVERGQMAY